MLCTPSRFLREIPDACLEEIRPQIQLRRPVHNLSGPRGGGFREWSSPRNDQVAGLKLGQRVSHPTFGEGVVLQFEGDGDRARIQVNFSDVGSKWLVAGFAKLQPL
jgi:DNA helicase-2/ATP-dependent DNA helicase PcrA